MSKKLRMNSMGNVRLSVLAAVFLVISSATATAQQITSSVAGTVTDENKAVVANASVIVESPQLALRRTVASVISFRRV